MCRRLIGMVTPHYAPNYGAKLQAFALAEALRELGFDVEFINRRPHVGEYIVDLPILKEAKRLAEYYNNTNFSDFENKYLQPQTKVYYTNEELANLDVSRYYGFTVGSDQMWRDDYYRPNYTSTSYLNFTDGYNVKRVAYAVSFGKATCEYSEERRKKIEKWVKHFSAISVREKSGVDILKNVFGYDKGVWVTDPTLLLDKDKYIELFHLDQLPEPRNELVTYILYDTWGTHNVIQDVGKHMGIYTRHFLKPRGCKVAYNRLMSRLPRFYKKPRVESWLDSLLNAKYVLTDSFHGTVFSIVFRKQFVVLDNSVGGSERLDSLLGMIGLKDRMFKYLEPRMEIAHKLTEPIDYNNVRNRMKPFIRESWQFLKDSFK